jgi:hypothetical protein
MDFGERFPNNLARGEFAPVVPPGYFSSVVPRLRQGSVRRRFLYAILALLVWTANGHAHGQTVPSITSISPSTVGVGSSAFTLTVTGSGYVNASSTVQVNGSNRPTVFKSALQVTATIFASDVASPATLRITVFNFSATGGGATSNSAPLTVTALPPPSLTSSAPEIAAQAASRMQMTLVGANFRPGATVVISPPLAAVIDSDGHTRATDVNVVSVVRVNSNLMTAIVSLSPKATLGLRAVDVLNFDGTSTAGSITNGVGGTSQPIQVEASNSLAAPLSVLNIAVTQPRDGTVVAQGQELNAAAILAGTGTGMVIGQWVWDGNVVEQFSASIVGGQSTTIQTRQSLPTWFLGAHTLQLRMVQPNQIATRPIVVAVTPEGWQLEQLVLPGYGAAYTADAPPRFLWAPIPGAAKYQVAFSSEPYVSKIQNWFDVVDNRWDIPPEVWKNLPEGQLYWTVRAIEGTGAPRKPLPLRSIYRTAAGGLNPSHPTPGRTAAGNTLLEWQPALPFGYYFVTISADSAATQVIRQYLTSNPRVDLRAADHQLTPGTTYYWQVVALLPNGNPLLSGEPQSFVAQNTPKASLADSAHLVRLASLGTPAALPAPAPDLAAQIAGRTPAPNSTTSELQPPISASFATAVNPADISLMVDDVDITSLAQATEMGISFKPPLALAGGDHNVNLTVGSEALTWKFTEAAPAGATPAAGQAATQPAVQPGTDAESSPSSSPATGAGNLPTSASIAAAHAAKPGSMPGAQSAAKTRPSEEGQISSTTQWSSGENPPDTNTFSVSQRFTYQSGRWHFEQNGSGLLSTTFFPEVQRTSHGLINDYVFQVGYKVDKWGANLRFGIVSPVLYTDAQFVTAATPRQGVEATLSSPAGTLGYYANTNDEALGGGAGINFHQQIMGASWQAPLPKWATFRVMWLSAKDIGAPTEVSYDSMGNPIITQNPVAAVSKGNVYGALLNIHLTPKWLWSSEYAYSRQNPDAANPASSNESGRAWRTGISGQAGKTNLNASYRDVGPNFGNPANPSLTQSSQPDLRGVDSAISETTKAGTFGLTYTFLENNVHPTTAVELMMNSFNETWSRPLDIKTNLVVGARQSLTQTGTVPASLEGQPPAQTGAADQRDVSGNVSLTRQIGTVSLSAGGTRDWSRDNLTPANDTITSSLNFGTNLTTKGIFQLNSQASVNWVAADGLTVGTTRNITVYVQPALVWKKPALQVAPLVTFTKGRTLLADGMLTSNTLTGQYGGRITWTLPGVLKFSTFSAQGSYNQNRNTIMSINQPSTQLLVLWTATWGHKHTF